MTVGRRPPLQRALRHAVHEETETGAAQQESRADRTVPRRSVPVRSRKSAPKITAAMPSGRLTKKTQRHERFVTKNPPSTGPRAGAIVVGR